MSTNRIRCEEWVCVDCYLALHLGWRYRDGASSDEPAGYYIDGGNGEPVQCPGAPLNRLDDALYVADWTDSNTGEGIRDFTWASCDGCGSSLGGSRYRLAADYAPDA